MKLQEHENAVKTAIDNAARELDAPDWNEFLATAGEYLNEKDEELASKRE